MFRFKQFSILNEHAAFKVGTDAVLLGAAATLPSMGNPAAMLTGQALTPSAALRFLDIGTGTGVVALCLAQRMSAAGIDFRATGIDIDSPSADEAATNFASSPWAGSLEARNAALADFGKTLPDTDSYDLIVSNPPYFEASLRNPDPRESAARHTDLLSYRDILAFASMRLRSVGRLALILPASCEVPLCRLAATFALRLDRILRIRTTSRKAPSRIIAEFVPCSGPAAPARHEELIIRDGGEYTRDYLNLTSPFYL